MPVRRVRWRRRVTAEHGSPTCKVDLGGQAVEGMRRELRKELMPRNEKSSGSGHRPKRRRRRGTLLGALLLARTSLALLLSGTLL